MRDDYERGDRPDRRMRRRRRDYDYDTYPTDKPVSALGVVALVKGILALVVSLIPCFGMFAIPAAGIALFLAVLSLVVARQSRYSMGIPIAATAVSGCAVVASILWIAVLGAMFRGEERIAVRPVPPVLPPPQVQPQFKAFPPPLKKAPEPKIDDEAAEKKVFEELAKDRIKEAIRNGPGTPATAAELEEVFTTNVVAADVKYKDKVVAVSGKVVRVVRDDAKAVYTLEIATDDPTKTVSCDFTEQTKNGLASCKRGSEVKIRGLCVGRVNEFVKLKDCVVVK